MRPARSQQPPLMPAPQQTLALAAVWSGARVPTWAHPIVVRGARPASANMSGSACNDAAGKEIDLAEFELVFNA